MQMLPELDGGGVERGTLEAGRYLVRQGHRSLVVSGGGRLVEQLEAEGSEHIRMDVGRKSLLTAGYVLPLRKLMRREKVDILHLRSRVPAWVGYLAWKSLPESERPVLVTTFHGFYSVNGYSAVMAKGEVVIAVSDAIRSHIAERYGRKEKVVTIHRGVDGESFSPALVSEDRLAALRRQWRLQDGGRVIMLPGRFTRWKGQLVLLHALALLKGNDYQAVLVGDPGENQGYAAELREAVRDGGLEETVRMVGHCQDMPAAYLLSDLVVSASSGQAEAFGRVTVEAMAMGRPVIATAHGGSLETVVDGETGWLVPPGDAQAMAVAIDKALRLSADALKSIGDKGRSRVLAEFTTETMCRQTLGLYLDLLEKRWEA